MEDIPSFSTSQQEIEYWKSKALSFQLQFNGVKEEFQEFQDGSKELELELEAQLEQSERSLKEYKSVSQKLRLENDSLKEKYEQCQREYCHQITELQSEVSEVKSIRDHLKNYIRELEQQNDVLERAKRETLASLEDLESRMNVAIERNAFLESELDEKECLRAVAQRMKDETRDLRAELKILAGKQRLSTSCFIDISGDFSVPDNDRSLLTKKAGGKTYEQEAWNDKNLLVENGSLDSNKLSDDALPKESWLEDTPPTSTKTSPQLAPTTRLSALTIVSDLLRKVGALELKLSSCRNIVKEKQTAKSTP